MPKVYEDEMVVRRSYSPARPAARGYGEMVKFRL